MAKTVTVTGSGNGVIGSSASDAICLGREALGQNEVGDKINYGGPLHVVLFGPNGAGKGMRVLVPNLLSMVGKSIVVIDPKGQLAAMTAKHRHEIGDDVKIIDPFGVLAEVVRKDPQTYRYLSDHGLVESAGFNPLAALHPDSPSFYEDSAIIAEALIKVSAQDPHWGESAQGLMTGLIMWEKKRNGARANLENVRALLTEAERWEPQKHEESGDWVERIVGGLAATAKKMVGEGGYEIASLAGRFAGERRTDELESIISTADTQTRWLLSKKMRDDLSGREIGDMKKSGVDFRKLKEGKKPMTVYVILPSKYLETHSIWLRLVVSEAIRASLTAGGRRIVLMLDEFAALGHLPMIERNFAVTRDYRVQLWPVLQDLPQIKRFYPESWETMLGMAGAVHTFRAANRTTADYFSQQTGSTTVVAVGYNQSSGTSSGGGWNSQGGLGHQQIERPTVTPQQMLGMKEGYMLGWLAGQEKPFPMFAPKFNRVASLRARALPNPYHFED
jgi:type IV secretion system protein VirD4